MLVDAGGECGGYTADITRTWPVSGVFSAPQRALYEAVLRVQEACIAAVRPGATLSGLRPFALSLLHKELNALVRRCGGQCLRVFV